MLRAIHRIKKGKQQALVSAPERDKRWDRFTTKHARRTLIPQQDILTAVLMEHHGNSKGTRTQTIGTTQSDSATVRSPNVSDPKSREFQLL